MIDWLARETNVPREMITGPWISNHPMIGIQLDKHLLEDNEALEKGEVEAGVDTAVWIFRLDC